MRHARFYRDACGTGIRRPSFPTSFRTVCDIYETDDALGVVLEIPGVEKKYLDVGLENNVLRVDARIDYSKYKDLEPVYNIGHYARSFALSSTIDQEKISANLEDGVLTLTLPKAKHAQPRKIAIG
jgi:HSP20 family protein